VLVRLGDPRVVPCFHCTFLLGMPSSTATGSPSAVLTQSFPDDIGLRLEPTARHSQGCPSSASDGRRVFAASLVRFRYGLSSCLSPWRIWPGGFSQPTETFTSELSNGSVALPAVGYNYGGHW